MLHGINDTRIGRVTGGRSGSKTGRGNNVRTQRADGDAVNRLHREQQKRICKKCEIIALLFAYMQKM